MIRLTHPIRGDTLFVLSILRQSKQGKGHMACMLQQTESLMPTAAPNVSRSDMRC